MLLDESRSFGKCDQEASERAARMIETLGTL